MNDLNNITRALELRDELRLLNKQKERISSLRVEGNFKGISIQYTPCMGQENLWISNNFIKECEAEDALDAFYGVLLYSVDRKIKNIQKEVETL